MGVFKCETCGNLHGAPVESCGICGSKAIVQMQEPVQGQEIPAPPGASPPDAGFADAIRPLFEEALDYVRARDRERESRCADLDARENERRERVTHAMVDLLGQATTFVDKLIELAEQLAVYVQEKTKAPAQPPQQG